jgi:energy-converting hydrogenase Eha subunit B
MIQKIKHYLLITASILMMATPALVPVAVAADAASSNGCGTNIADQVAQGATEASGNDVNCNDNSAGDASSLTSLARNIVNIFSIIVGAVAVIMIIYGGFRYITSGGDSNSVGSAKNTLIYAIVGLIIVALAQIIVRFVLTQSSNAVQ